MELVSTGPMFSCCYNGTSWKKLRLDGAIDNESREEKRTTTALGGATGEQRSHLIYLLSLGTYQVPCTDKKGLVN